jgi:hypothetical protein
MRACNSSGTASIVRSEGEQIKKWGVKGPAEPKTRRERENGAETEKTSEKGGRGIV